MLLMRHKIITAIFFLFGLIFILLGLFLAYQYQFKNFYEVLLIGVLVFLFGFDAPKNISLKKYILTYFLFIILGLLGDLLMGLTITKLWVYNYSSLIQYFLLYLWIYPVGGLTVTLSFIVALDIFNANFLKKVNSKLGFRDEILFMSIGILLFISFWICSRITGINYVGILIQIAFVFPLYLFLNLGFAKWRQVTYFELLRKDTWKVVAASLVSVYTMAFLHEIPNVATKQWVYKDIPLMHITIFDIPFIVLCGWIVLLIFPLTIFLKGYTLKDLDRIIKD